jgi:hypothetical protein
MRLPSTVLQIGGELFPSLTTGESILLIGLFGVVTLLVMALDSALNILAWSLSGVIMILVLLGQLSIELFLVAVAFDMLAIGATGAYTTRYA